MKQLTQAMLAQALQAHIADCQEFAGADEPAPFSQEIHRWLNTDDEAGAMLDLFLSQFPIKEAVESVFSVGFTIGRHVALAHELEELTK